MDKKNLQVIVLILILVGVLIVAVSFLVGKYEKEVVVTPVAPVQQIAPVQQSAPVNLIPPENKAEETQDLLQPGDDQFPTEKGKFLQ
ncbi:MAG: hypothetical protein NTY14_01405 [Candidatus Omnitrophica bacterium]|nr:hypothetical protein [Candidatus Omnitrophota bacterium]